LHPVPTAPVPRLEIPRYDLPAALALERELGVSHVLAQVLVRRGLSDPAQARGFLEAAESHAPQAFAGLADAVSLIERHAAAGNPITVHGDYDVDGVCATTVMVRALRELGGRVDWFLPSRTEDGYGFTTATVDRLVARGTRLVITVDCGITAVEEVAEARRAGLEVVVTDHHRPRSDGQLPGCPVVHPEICGYPCPHLCGTGVAYKLACALGAASAEADLELVALATVADLVPLSGENRRLVRAGLRALGHTEKPGLRALMAVSRCDPSDLDAGSLGFRLAPRINAAGRLARADAGVELLLCPDPDRAQEIALELDRLNAERRAIEERMTWEAEAQVAELGQRDAYVLAAEGWHPGVIGIVASRIVERYHRPAVLVALSGAASAQGSGRSIPGFDLLSALHACSKHLERYGGHRAAAGLTIRPAALESFRAALEAHAASELTPELLAPREVVDAIVSGSDMGLGLAEELERLEPIGAPRPRLLIPAGRFEDCRAMGEGKHARFTVLAGGSRTPAVAFGCGGSLDAKPGEAVDASFRLERNCWNGAVEPRLLLRHAWPCAPEPIALLDPDQGYLAAALAELERPLEEPLSPDEVERSRTVLDRRGQSPLSVLADAQAADGAVVAVCADIPRRLEGLRARCGGFGLVSYHALERDSAPGLRAAHLVALDPPAGEAQANLLQLGAGFTHLAWGEAELRFAQHMHELEYGLRRSLTALYRALRPLRRVAGEEVEQLLRGDGAHARPPRLAGRLVRVLTELELVQLDPDRPALATSGAARTTLERSPAYRAYAKRYQDGRLFLSSASPQPSG
jgi:single-stranded-DNA-specific exonuclease